eukprot:g68235.t1
MTHICDSDSVNDINIDGKSRQTTTLKITNMQNRRNSTLLLYSTLTISILLLNSTTLLYSTLLYSTLLYATLLYYNDESY